VGVTKSPGPPIKLHGGKSGPAPANLPADNKNKDIYFEKDFGSATSGWKNAMYKDKNMAIDKARIAEETKALKKMGGEGPAYTGG